MQVKFSRNGMSEEQLLEIAQINKGKEIDEQEWYGHGAVIRQYGFFPKNWKLKPYIPHGVSLWDKISKSRTLYTNGYDFFFSKRLSEIFYNTTGKKSYIITSPFVLYKRLYKKTKDKNAKGSIVFPSHSISEIDVIFDIDALCYELHNLPEKFKPIHVCLFYVDVLKGDYKKYIEHGFPVHCAGSRLDKDFVINWYEIVTHFKYGLGNEIGSHLFYLTDLDIPFSLIGEKPVNFNKSCLETGKLGEFDYEHEQIKVCRDLFRGLYTGISEEQLEFVAQEISLHDGIGRVETAIILYKSWFKHHFINNFIGKLYEFFPYLRVFKNRFIK